MTIAENSVRPSYAGNGEPGATVTLADAGGMPIASAPVAPDGTWSIPPQYGIDPGITGFRLTQTGTSGLTSEPVVLGPYAFRLQPLFSTADQPCGPAQWGVQGWEEAPDRHPGPDPDGGLHAVLRPPAAVRNARRIAPELDHPDADHLLLRRQSGGAVVSYGICGG